MGGCHTEAVRIPPARAAQLTQDALDALPPPPARVLEVGFAGIHAEPLRLAGYTVEVLDDDPRAHMRAKAIERAGSVVAAPSGRYDAVVVPADADVSAVDAATVIRLHP
jgi:hypothetical protein